MTKGRVRVGIVGCGTVTQVAHLPALRFLADLFEVVALCDVDVQVLRKVARQNGVDRCFADHEAMLTDEGIDAVLIANPHIFHSPVTLASIRAGKHVLVEKPMCMTLRECDEIATAVHQSGVVVQIGYMRRHSPTVSLARAWVEDLGGVLFAQVHDVVGRNELIVEQVARVTTATVGPEAQRVYKDTEECLMEEALGHASAAQQNAYRLLLALACHDTSLAREVLGRPRRVLYCASRQRQGFITAAFDQGPFVTHFEVGVDDVARYDTKLEVYCRRGVVRLEFDTPYVRNLPVRLIAVEASGRGLMERSLQADWSDPFIHEWRDFYENIGKGVEPKASATDFRLDLELFHEMLRVLEDA